MLVGAGLIRGRVPRCSRATLAVDPAGVTAQVMLLLPDGQAVLDFVDDVTARAERLVTVRRAHAHPHGELADRERPDAMHAGGMRHTEARDRLGDDALALAHAERLKSFVLQAAYALALVAVA